MRESDMGSLFRIYASTRVDELALTDWDEAQKEAFLRQQFGAQHAHYRQHYPGASFDLILVDGATAGRLYLDRWPDQLRIVDIALLPEWRGRGIGGALLRSILERAAALGLPVTIHVEQFNPALSLYERLGFRPVSMHGVYLLMRWSPEEENDAEHA
jgi:GNAT superfamily N-acetyltransferase